MNVTNCANFIYKMLESEIQTKIKKRLEKSGWMVNKMIQTTMNGWPDIEAYCDGARVCFIEVKNTTGRLSDLQIFRHEQLRKKGFEVIVARSIDDIKHLL